VRNYAGDQNDQVNYVRQVASISADTEGNNVDEKLDEKNQRG
jgi:hypothetical protein